MLVVTVVCSLFYAFIHVVRICGFVSSVLRERAVKKSDKTIPTSAATSEGVTILRPMKGADSELYKCLESAFTQTYEPLEIIMCCADAKDPSLRVAERLIAEHPDVDAKIIVNETAVGVNPKICNLIDGYKQAKYDKIWVLDSNVITSRNSLLRAAPLLSKQKNIGLVHHLPAAIAGKNAEWGAMLDDVYMGTVHSLFYAGINSFGIAPCVMGKSNMFFRSELDSAVNADSGAGLEHFAKYLPEDYMIAEALWKTGLRTALAPDVVVQPLGNMRIKEYWLRRIRWIRLRKYMVISATLVEPFTDCFFANAFFCLSMSFSMKFLPQFLLLSLSWMMMDYANYTTMFAKAQQTTNVSSLTRGQFAFSWLLRELSAFPLWVLAICGRRVYWRNKEYRIHPDLVAEEI